MKIEATLPYTPGIQERHSTGPLTVDDVFIGKLIIPDTVTPTGRAVSVEVSNNVGDAWPDASVSRTPGTFTDNLRTAIAKGGSANWHGAKGSQLLTPGTWFVNIRGADAPMNVAVTGQPKEKPGR